VIDRTDPDLDLTPSEEAKLGTLSSSFHSDALMMANSPHAAAVAVVGVNARETTVATSSSPSLTISISDATELPGDEDAFIPGSELKTESNMEHPPHLM
jgi:hypothetical protein